MRNGRARTAVSVVAAALAGAVIWSAEASAVTAAEGSHSLGAATLARCERLPALRGLALAAARVKAARSGCRLRVRNPGSSDDDLRLVADARLHRDRHGPFVEVRLDPLCYSMGAPGPPPGEPIVKAGPTQLISGLFLAGGPLEMYSAPTCSRVGTPSPGTITVTDATTGATVATQAVASGGLATFPLPPGNYVIAGTFGNATVNGAPITTAPQTVTVSSGYTVREDVVADIP
jgi:hypothetical protein